MRLVQTFCFVMKSVATCQIPLLMSCSHTVVGGFRVAGVRDAQWSDRVPHLTPSPLPEGPNEDWPLGTALS